MHQEITRQRHLLFGDRIVHLFQLISSGGGRPVVEVELSAALVDVPRQPPGDRADSGIPRPFSFVRVTVGTGPPQDIRNARVHAAILPKASLRVDRRLGGVGLDQLRRCPCDQYRYPGGSMTAFHLTTTIMRFMLSWPGP